MAMKRDHVRSIGRVTRGFAGGVVATMIAAWVTLPVVGCRTGADGQGAAIAEPRGATTVDYDPKRALLTLKEIKPDPPAPRAAEEPVPELSARAARRLNRARSLYEEQRYTEASLELEGALRLEPEHPLLHREMALALMAAGNAERVRTHLMKAAELKDDDARTHYLLGKVSADDGQWARAMEEYRVALKASNLADEPGLPALCRFQLARALNAEGYLTAAIDAYRQFELDAAGLADASVDAELRTLLKMNGGRAGVPISVAYEKLGRYAEAAEALAEALEGGSPDAANRERLARLLSRAGRHEEALVHARALLEEDDRAVGLLEEIHRAAGQPERFVEEVRAAYERQPERVALLLTYVDALQRGGSGADRARDMLRDALERHPDQGALRWKLAELSARAGEWKEVLSLVAGAMRQDPTDWETAKSKLLSLAAVDAAVDALLGAGEEDVRRIAEETVDEADAYLLGALAVEVGRGQSGVEVLFPLALSRSPGFTPARAALGEALLDRFAWQQAIETVTGSEEALRRDGRLAQIAGRAYAGLDDYGRAEAFLRDAIRLNRSDVAALFALAGVHELAKEPRRAIQQYEAILQLNPLHEASREALVLLYLNDREHRPEGVSQAAGQVAELRRLSASPHRIARCAALVELSSAQPPNWDRYRATLHAAMEAHGPEGLTWTRIGQSFAGQSRIEEAAEAARQALALTPDAVEAMELSAGLYEVSFAYREAAEVIRRLLERHPRRQVWNERLWRSLMLDHSFDEAYAWSLRQLERTDMDPDEYGQCRARAIMALGRADRHDERIALLRRWRQENDADASITAWLIDAYASAKRFNEAVDLAAEVYARDPQDRAVREELRTRLLEAKQYERAEQVLLEAMEIDPLDEILMRQLAGVLAVAGRHDDALELLSNYAVERERDEWVFEMRTAILQDARRFDEVLAILNEQLRAAEQSQEPVTSGEVHEIRRRVAIALMFAQRFDEAAQNLRTWIEETPIEQVRFVFLELLSQCHQNRGSTPDAIEALERAHAMAPSNVRSNNDLGYSLTDAGLRLEEAERMIRFALSRDPDNGAYIDSFGWWFYKKGRFDEARLWLSRAVNSEGGRDPVVCDHLGDALWRSGMLDEAEREWRRALELIQDESNADRPDLKRLLGRVQLKLDARSAGREPDTAPLAPPDAAREESDRTPPT